MNTSVKKAAEDAVMQLMDDMKFWGHTHKDHITTGMSGNPDYIKGITLNNNVGVDFKPMLIPTLGDILMLGIKCKVQPATPTNKEDINSLFKNWNWTRLNEKRGSRVFTLAISAREVEDYSQVAAGMTDHCITTVTSTCTQKDTVFVQPETRQALIDWFVLHLGFNISMLKSLHS